jgi:hypothetical protein
MGVNSTMLFGGSFMCFFCALPISTAFALALNEG